MDTISRHNSDNGTAIPAETAPAGSTTEQEDYPLLTDILPTLPDLADATQNERAWSELEQRLAQRILQRVEERIQYVIEDIIRQRLLNSIEKITGALVSEIKNDLQSTLDVVITHTVTDELHRMRQKEFFSENNQSKIAERQ